MTIVEFFLFELDYTFTCFDLYFRAFYESNLLGIENISDPKFLVKDPWNFRKFWEEKVVFLSTNTGARAFQRPSRQALVRLRPEFARQALALHAS